MTTCMIVLTVLGAGDKLTDAISKIVHGLLDKIKDNVVKRTASESLARVGLRAPQVPTKQNNAAFASNGYREFPVAASGLAESSLTTPAVGYGSIPNSNAHPYNLGAAIAPPRPSPLYSQQGFSNNEDSVLTATHAAAIEVAARHSSQSAAAEGYGYGTAASQVQDTSQAPYSNHGLTLQDWRQWSRTYIQPQPQVLGQPGEYLNTATTLMALGGGGGSGGNGAGTNGGAATSGAHNHSNHTVPTAHTATRGGVSHTSSSDVPLGISATGSSGAAVPQGALDMASTAGTATMTAIAQPQSHPLSHAHSHSQSHSHHQHPGHMHAHWPEITFQSVVAQGDVLQQ